MKDELYNTEQVADYFHVRVETVRDWVKRGILPGFKAGRDWRFSQQNLDDCVRALQVQTEEKRPSLEEKHPELHAALEREADMWITAGHADQWEAAKMWILDVLEDSPDLYWRWEPGVGIVFTNRPPEGSEAPQFDVAVQPHHASKK